MKKSLIIFCLLIISGILNAQYQVTQEQAVTAAMNTIRYNNRSNITSSNVEEVNTLHSGDTVFMYEVVFDTEDIVILSGNTTCSPILGYILHDNMETQSILDNYDNIPDGLKEMINEYLEEIKYCFRNNISTGYQSEWQELYEYQPNRARRTEIVSPLITSKWGQHVSNDGNDTHAYNYYVTENNNGKSCYAGCVAVAMGQIMNYWKYPVHVSNRPKQFDWCNMSDELNTYSDNYEQERNAVAGLLRDCGTSVNMIYCYNGCESGALDRDALEAFKEYGFSNVVIEEKKLFSGWKQLLKDELDSGRPVYYSGGSEEVGHAFVCDGYDSNNMFHFNWGWNGKYDGWFKVRKLNPNGDNFSSNQIIIRNIYPDTNQDYCDFSLDLSSHYDKFYNEYNLNYIRPYNNIPQTATILRSVPDTSSYPATWRTIPAGATSEYVAHEEIILQDGFVAEEYSNFHAYIEPCSSCDDTRTMESYESRSNTNYFNTEKNEYTRKKMVEDGYENTYIEKEEEKLSSINIYPNPTKDVLNISFSNNEENIRQVQIVNTMGTIMLDKANLTNNVIDINSISSGLYIVKIITNKGNVYFEKVVIEH